MKITIFGSGAFGYAIALMLHKNGNQITIWCSTDDKADKLNKHEEEIIPGIKIPDDIKFTHSYEEAMMGDIIFLIPAAKYIHEVCMSIKDFVRKDQVFCIGSKGIEQGTCKFVSEVFKDIIDSKNYAVISGPSFAVDVACNEPIGFSLATSNKHTDSVIKKVLSSDTIKLRSSSDMIGVELCGAIKNVIAIASGIISGLGYKESTRSFLIVESMHDIKELIHGLGGKKKTILSFAGIGDLLLTCTSTKSRNYSYGIILGEKDFDKANLYLKENTVEGFYTLKSIYTLIKRKKIDMPVIDLIYKIVMQGEDPEKLIEFLINKK